MTGLHTVAIKVLHNYNKAAASGGVSLPSVHLLALLQRNGCTGDIAGLLTFGLLTLPQCCETSKENYPESEWKVVSDWRKLYK